MTQTARPRQTDDAIRQLERKQQTPLGKRLRVLRQKLIAAGEPLLDWDEIDRELADRRGEL